MLSTIALPKAPPGESVSAGELHAVVTVLFGRSLEVWHCWAQFWKAIAQSSKLRLQ